MCVTLKDKQFGNLYIFTEWKGQKCHHREGANESDYSVVFLSGLHRKLSMRNASLASPVSPCISL